MSDADEIDELPLPPLPPGISLPPPPPPPPLEDPIEEIEDTEIASKLIEDNDEDSNNNDFKSQWESRKANDPASVSYTHLRAHET